MNFSQEQEDLIKISIMNFFIYTFLLVIIAIWNGVETNGNYMGSSTTLENTVASIFDENYNVVSGDIITNFTNIKRTDENSGAFDILEGIMDFGRAISNFIAIIIKSNFPIVTITDKFKETTSNVLMQMLITLFAFMWQLAITYNWFKFIFSYRMR